MLHSNTQPIKFGILEEQLLLLLDQIVVIDNSNSSDYIFQGNSNSNSNCNRLYVIGIGNCFGQKGAEH